MYTEPRLEGFSPGTIGCLVRTASGDFQRRVPHGHGLEARQQGLLTYVYIAINLMSDGRIPAVAQHQGGLEYLVHHWRP